MLHRVFFLSFRFDCGTGPAQITSENLVELGQWNTITVHRNDWNGWIQLNDGPQAKGRSKVRILRVFPLTRMTGAWMKFEITPFHHIMTISDKPLE